LLNIITMSNESVSCAQKCKNEHETSQTCTYLCVFDWSFRVVVFKRAVKQVIEEERR
jgi:hypothetical protein